MKYFNEEFERINRWQNFRNTLYKNEEPSVELIASTEAVIPGVTTETLPAFTARQSHESAGSSSDDLKLNKKLIAWGHTTPLEAVQFVFHVTGISKSLAGQWTRHRTGIGWTFRSTRYVNAANNKFIYPALEYIDSPEEVTTIYEVFSKIHSTFADTYTQLNFTTGIKNQELRRLMPVGFSTAAYVYVNARALRHFFTLRLSKHAEWEIRRLAYLLFDEAVTQCPTLFEDLATS